jgi:hypothetical protein
MTIDKHQNGIAAMAGFDAEFRDLDHYIRIITERIWEGRRINDIRHYYSDPCVVETPSSVSTSVQSVINSTEATLKLFPDRRLLAEDIIQSGDSSGGFLSSHRIISTMTHLGDGNFGRATGKPIHARTIAECVCKDNRIVHEWLVRDQSAIAIQIGISPKQLAKRWLDDSAGWTKAIAPPPPNYYVSHLSQDPSALGYAAFLSASATGAGGASDHELVSRTYDDAVHHLGPGGSTRYGHAEVGRYWQTLFTNFSVANFAVEHLAAQRGDGRADRVAIRWRAATKHTGGSADASFGVATGNLVEIMGINHVEFWRGRVLREWVLIDEIALWMQILGGSSNI